MSIPVKPGKPRIAHIVALGLIISSPYAASADGTSENASARTGAAAAGDGPSAMSLDDLDSQIDSLNTTFVSAVRSILTAQAITASALGMKDQATKLTSEAKSLEGGNDLKVATGSITLSQDASKELDTKFAQSQVADANAQVELAKAVPQHVAGLESLGALGAGYQNWMRDAMTSLNALKDNPTMAPQAGRYQNKVAEVLAVIAQIPSLYQGWSHSAMAIADALTQSEN